MTSTTARPVKEFKGTLKKSLINQNGGLMIRSKNFDIVSSNGKEISLWNEELGLRETVLGSVSSVSYLTDLEDGNFLSVSSDHKLKLWNSMNMSYSTTINELLIAKAIIELPDGDLACGNIGDEIEIWSLNGQMKRKISGNLNQKSIINTLALTKKFDVVAGLSDGSLNFWSIINSLFIRTVKLTSLQIKKILVLPTGDLAIASFNSVTSGNIIITDENGNLKRVISHIAYDIAFLSSGFLACLTGDGVNIKIINFNDGSLYRTISGNSNHGLLALTSDLIATGCSDNSIKIYNITSGSVIKNMQGHVGLILYLSKMKNGDLVSVSRDNKIKIWNIEHSSVTVDIKAHDNEITSFLVLENGDLLSNSNNEFKLKRWRSEQGFKDETMTDTRWGDLLIKLKDGDLAGAYPDFSIKIWSIQSSKIKKELFGHSNHIKALLQFNDDTLISGSSDRTIKIWNLSNSSLIKTLLGHTNTVTCLAMLSANLLASSSIDGIKLWNLTDGSLLRTLTGHTDFINSIIILPNNNLLSASSDKTLKEWDIDSYLLIKSINNGYPVNSIINLPSGNIASLGTNGINIWE